ncbi:MAG: hypothetical protein IK045_09140 [Bacteroidales bacterium]|nr:hypothetical protein [Bacteroidales bacterium]
MKKLYEAPSLRSRCIETENLFLFTSDQTGVTPGYGDENDIDSNGN